MKVDPEKLSFDLFSTSDNFSTLDFTEDDGKDPLGIDDFIKNRVQDYLPNKLASIWTVRYESVIVAYFTTSMFAIGVKQLFDDEHVKEVPIVSYPAVLLGRMGVHKKERGRDIGYWICQFCTGLAQEIGKRIACRYIVLQTIKTKSTYYEKKCMFHQTKRVNPEGKIWMYRRLS